MRRFQYNNVIRLVRSSNERKYNHLSLSSARRCLALSLIDSAYPFGLWSNSLGSTRLVEPSPAPLPNDCACTGSARPVPLAPRPPPLDHPCRNQSRYVSLRQRQLQAIARTDHLLEHFGSHVAFLDPILIGLLQWQRRWRRRRRLKLPPLRLVLRLLGLIKRLAAGSGPVDVLGPRRLGFLRSGQSCIGRRRAWG